MGAWIETIPVNSSASLSVVAPFMGAWIETSGISFPGWKVVESHPSWVRGLKHLLILSFALQHTVAPFMGAWIETIPVNSSASLSVVAPFMGAWIETSGISFPGWKVVESHPSWVRGLKHLLILSFALQHTVAPFMGAWIETIIK